MAMVGVVGSSLQTNSSQVSWLGLEGWQLLAAEAAFTA